MRKMKSKQGFTLIELMVVVIIVGILAAVAVPLMTANKDKAMNSEAVAALGAISTAARLYMVESNGTAPTAVGDLENAGLLDMGDLDGTYYQNSDYGNVAFDSQGKVSGAVVGPWTFTWNSTTTSYTTTR